MKSPLSAVKIVSCPRCGSDAEFSVQNPFRPFCSERCKLIDLGDWASENFKIPVTNETPQSIDDENSETDDQ